MNTMGELFKAYEIELIEKEKQERPADEARRMARWKAERQAEIDAGLRDADGEWIGPDPADQEDEGEIDYEFEEDEEQEDDL